MIKIFNIKRILIIGFIILLTIFVYLVSAQETTLCYQEWANVSTACGGLNTGNYQIASGTFLNFNYFLDASWNGSMYSSGTNGYLYINYTKPTNSVSPSIWMVQDKDGIFNLSINSSHCWNRFTNTLAFRVIADSSPLNTTWQCLDTTEWYTLKVPTLMNRIYEDGMWWNITTTPESECWSHHETYIFIPKGCVYTKLKGNFTI